MIQWGRNVSEHNYVFYVIYRVNKEYYDISPYLNWNPDIMCEKACWNGQINNTINIENYEPGQSSTYPHKIFPFRTSNIILSYKSWPFGYLFKCYKIVRQQRRGNIKQGSHKRYPIRPKIP
jgi:hypothetical protein